MYKEFYNFRAMPFDQVIDQKSIFLSENFETPLAILVSGLDKGIKLHVVYGEKGVGKTTFISYVYQHIQLHCKAGLISKGYESKGKFLAHAMECFGYKARVGSIFDLLDQFGTILANEYLKNRNLPSLLVIDNAEELNYDIFEIISELLQLHVDNHSILQIILIGDNQLSKNLDISQNQSALKQIDIVRNHLKPLTFQETKNYIHHRLNRVGYSNQFLFNEQTCQILFELSGGIPFEINALCHQALALASQRKVNQISPGLIKDLNIFRLKARLIEQLDISKKAANDSNNNFNQNWKKLAPLAGALCLLLAFAANQFTSLTTINPNSPKPDLEIKVASATVQEVHRATTQNRSGNDIKSLKSQMTQLKTIKPPGFSETFKESLKDKSTFSKNQNTQINALLAKAEQQILDSKLLTPQGDNAFRTYSAILSKAPKEKRAHAGLDNIAERYLIMAKNKLQQGEFPTSKILINRGLKAVPNHHKLVALKSHIDDQLARRSQHRKILSLLSQANRQLDQLNFIEPNRHEAYLTYLEILRIDKNNSEALQGIASINNLATQQINSCIEKRDYNSVLLMTSNILSMPAADKYLATAFKTVTQGKQLVNDFIAELNIEAEQYLDSKHYVTPQGNNAAEKFRKILTIDPKNKQAHSGLNKISKHYQYLANNALLSGKNKEAFSLVNTALKAFPYHEKLLELQNKIAIVLSEERIQIAGNIQDENIKIEVKKQLRPFGNF